MNRMKFSTIINQPWKISLNWKNLAITGVLQLVRYLQINKLIIWSTYFIEVIVI